jgi:uncharacterized protein with beta-barrel porin domain
MNMLTNLTICALVLACGALAESKVKMEDLPLAVQKTAKEQSKNATLAGLSKEVEGGKTVYEIETKVNGKSRDLLVDATGAVIEVEEEVEMNSLPAAAQEAIRQKIGGGKLKKVEAVTKGSSVSYEASYVGRLGKSSEITVNADGTAHK